jgi:uncharacterized protein
MRVILWSLTLLVCSVIVPATLSLTAQVHSDLPTDSAVDVIWGEKIPMRDGIALNATIYRPHAQTGPLPVLFTLTPYMSDTYHERGMYFARNGYVFVLVDSRGRGNSGGDFAPFVNDGRDGYDAVEWLARQSWCNSKVGMWGGSYSGFNQWTTLAEAPPHLATIVPVASAYPAIDMPMVNNIHDPYWIQWFALVEGRTLNTNFSEDHSFWEEKFRQLFVNHLPFEQLDRLAGMPSAGFQEWLKHPSVDEYWERMAPGEAQYRRMRIPILTITGEYDRAQPGALAFYSRHMQYGGSETAAKHYLIIGPWDHSGTRTPRAEIGGLSFGPASTLDMNKLHKEWYDWTLKSGAKPEFLKDRVAYYAGGAEQWEYASELSGVSKVYRTLYLHSSGSAGDLSTSGLLNEQIPRAESPDHYTYDPMDVRPATLERDNVSFGWWPGHSLAITGQNLASSINGNGLIYHTAPFSQDTKLAGFPGFSAWMAIDAPDTDFQVMLYEIKPDGQSIALSVDRMRARYRESLKRETPVKPGELNQYEFKSFTFVCRRISKDSRLRLVITSPNSIFAEKNYNAGGVVTRESGKDSHVAHVTLYHDAQHPSRLDVPLGN